MVILRRAAVAILLAVTALPASARQAHTGRGGSRPPPRGHGAAGRAGRRHAGLGGAQQREREYALSRLARFREEGPLGSRASTPRSATSSPATAIGSTRR